MRNSKPQFFQNATFRFIFTTGFFLITTGSFAEKTFSEESIRVGIENDELYFSPENRNDTLSLNGTIYDYTSKSCFRMIHQTKPHKIEAKPTKCSQPFLSEAEEPYDTVSDFEIFKKKFIACAQRQMAACLRRLTWRNIQISFGVDGLGDRRELLYKKWNKNDFEELANLLSKGISPDEETREFPYPQEEDYIGKRGLFQKKNGGWLLVSYLSGD